MKRTTLMVWLPLLVSACAVSRVDPLSVPLSYTQSPKNAGLSGALACNALSQVQVSDARSDKTLGVRVHESQPLKADVTAASDPGVWVQQGMQSVLAQNGVIFQNKGPQLLVSIDALHTTESIWHRSSYQATIAITGRLESPSGKACWQETSRGQAENYGYSGSNEDYQETLNSALDTATLNLAQLQGFRDGLCKCSD